MSTPIDLMTTPLPSSTDTNNFDARADLAWSEFADRVVQFNTAFKNFNNYDLNATSTTSTTIGTGSKSLTTQTGKSFQKGMMLSIADDADPTKFMVGVVTAYNSGTGALTVDVQITNGSGTLANWVISLAAARDLAIHDAEVYLQTGNGTGSTNDKIRRYSTIIVNDGGASLTYADSSVNGALVTINETGIYAVGLMDRGPSRAIGISVNSNQLATAIESIAAADRVCWLEVNTTDYGHSVSTVTKFSAGDELRPHFGTLVVGSADAWFRVKRIF